MALLSSCLGKSTYRWKEEVQLHDGRVIVIERSVGTGQVPVEIGQPPGESDYTLTFKISGGKFVLGGNSFQNVESFAAQLYGFTRLQVTEGYNNIVLWMNLEYPVFHDYTTCRKRSKGR